MLTRTTVTIPRGATLWTVFRKLKEAGYGQMSPATNNTELRQNLSDPKLYALLNLTISGAQLDVTAEQQQLIEIVRGSAKQQSSIR